LACTRRRVSYGLGGGEVVHQAHPGLKVRDLDRDAGRLLAGVLEGEVARPILDELAEKEGEDLLRIGGNAEVLPVSVRED
jgi:hypothetical protein